MFRFKAIVLLALLPAAAASAVQAQSLAEAAQQEAARRKEVKGVVRVITNKDLPHVPPATAAAPDQTATRATPPPVAGAVASGAAPAQDTQPPASTADDGGGLRDERYWRDRLGKAKAEVEHNQIFVDALQSRINGLTTDFVNRDDPAQRAVIATDRDKAVAELARLKKAIVDGAAAIAAIEEEARRAGVPAGWLR
jgi:hypothetical protein